MMTTDRTIDTCNELLRSEIAAIETYTQAIDKFDSATPDDVLERIRGVHQENAFELNKLVIESGADPTVGSGTWGGFIQALEVSDKLIGQSPALKILQTGEANGISQYENALANEDVHDAAKTLIRRALMPSLSGHLVDLQQRCDVVA